MAALYSQMVGWLLLSLTGQPPEDVILTGPNSDVINLQSLRTATGQIRAGKRSFYDSLENL